MRVAPTDAQLLLVIDVQHLVVDDTPWHSPGARDILPRIRQLAAAYGPATVATRHVPAADGGPGTWQAFHRRWADLLADERLVAIPDGLLPEGATVLDKSTYSCLDERLQARLEPIGATTLVVCGVETDCCVAATVLDAVDLGIPVIVVEDAVAGPDPDSHRGALAAWRRLPEQVTLRTTEQLLGA